jgi:hypothetical protein
MPRVLRRSGHDIIGDPIASRSRGSLLAPTASCFWIRLPASHSAQLPPPLDVVESHAHFRCNTPVAWDE